jgi:hypothetical protein
MNKLIVLFFVLVTGSAFASGEDLVNCLHNNGNAMNPLDCELQRKIAAEDKAKEDVYQKQRDADEAASKRRRADYDSGANLETCHWNTGTEIGEKFCEKLRKDQQEKERDAQHVRETAEAEIKRQKESDAIGRAFQLEQARELAAQKRKCGKDYRTIRIGMTIERLDECTAGASYVNETVTQDGVIETYRTRSSYVNVKNGKIISYTMR